jgi:methylenetetrahydrofolate dehydrogenase (NADP+)/methenyltetrahydrofolate cyclohydrolase
MVKDGVVVIDVGITRVPDETKEKGYVITGDVDFENVSKKQVYYRSRWSGTYDDSDVVKNTLLAREMKMLKLEK